MSFSDYIIVVTIISVCSIIGYHRFKIILRKRAEQYQLWGQQWKDWMQEMEFEFPVLYRLGIDDWETKGFKYLDTFIRNPDLVCYDYGDEGVFIDVNGKIVLLKFNAKKRLIFPAKIIDQKKTVEELLSLLDESNKAQLSPEEYEHVSTLQTVSEIITYLSSRL